MNKQTLIDDYKQIIERLQEECTEKTDLNIKLMERVKELEEKLNAQFAEMEEKLTAEELKNYELKEKLKIAEEALQYYANSEMPDDLYTSEKINGSAISTDNWAICGEFNQCMYKIYYDNETAQQALQKMKEETNDNSININ